MGVTKLQARGQVTIPARIRRAFGWKAGDTITFSARADGVVELRALKRLTVRELVEKFSEDGMAPDMRAVRREAEDAAFREKFAHGDTLHQ